MSEMILTQKGKSKIADFISECRALRKELLDANKDTSYDTAIPTEEDILSDIEDWFEDGDSGYFNNWGVTDNYDLGINLYYGEDFVKTQGLSMRDKELKKMLNKFNKKLDEACQLKSDIMDYIGAKYDVKPFDCYDYFSDDYTVCSGIDDELIEELENGEEYILRDLRRNR